MDQEHGEGHAILLKHGQGCATIGIDEELFDDVINPGNVM